MTSAQKFESSDHAQMQAEMAEKLREDAQYTRAFPKNNTNVDAHLPHVMISADPLYSVDKWLQNTLVDSPFHVRIDSEQIMRTVGDLEVGRHGVSYEGPSQFQASKP